MSSAGTRQRSLPLVGPIGISVPKDKYGTISSYDGVLANGKQMTVSQSNVMDRKTGTYRSGGSFYTSRISHFLKAGKVKDGFIWSEDKFYSGPVYGRPPSLAEMEKLGFKNVSLSYGDKNESQMKTDGTNAISYSAPTNPASSLGTTLAESVREGIPSLPGIQSWKRRTELLKGAGSEYLNYIFGWDPLVREVGEVRDAARHHRDIMKQYHEGEGRNTHRTFSYPSKRTEVRKDMGTEFPSFPREQGFWNLNGPQPQRQVSWVSETKRWFEGCYTYALPSSTDSWRRSMGYGSDADQLFGLTLTPSLLWELTPWSWAVDWFSNVGENINNITNFGLAGLVLRYGYMMEESIDIVTASGGSCQVASTSKSKPRSTETVVPASGWSRGFEIVTKRRVPASPFGFSIGWEGLSPTQLAITAALGITKLL